MHDLKGTKGVMKLKKKQDERKEHFRKLKKAVGRNA